MHQAIVNLFGGQAPICVAFNDSQSDLTVLDLKQYVERVTSIPVDEQRITTMGGIPLTDQDALFNHGNTLAMFDLSLRLRGGKGGFGSMLRAQGGRMNAQKTTNFEACRDLQGRRIRKVNEAKRLQEELNLIPKRERERRERLAKKIEEALKEPEKPVHRFDDTEYLEQYEQLMETVRNVTREMVSKQENNNNHHKQEVVPQQQAPAAVASVFDDADEEEEESSEED